MVWLIELKLDDRLIWITGSRARTEWCDNLWHTSRRHLASWVTFKCPFDILLCLLVPRCLVQKIPPNSTLNGTLQVMCAPGVLFPAKRSSREFMEAIVCSSTANWRLFQRITLSRDCTRAEKETPCTHAATEPRGGGGGEYSRCKAYGGVPL